MELDRRYLMIGFLQERERQAIRKVEKEHFEKKAKLLGVAVEELCEVHL